MHLNSDYLNHIFSLFVVLFSKHFLHFPIKIRNIITILESFSDAKSCKSVVWLLFFGSGSRTAQWLIEPIRFRHMHEFVPKLSSKKLVELWALTGAARISEIAARIGMPANKLTRYLAALQSLGYVKRIISITEKIHKRASGDFTRLLIHF